MTSTSLMKCHRDEDGGGDPIVDFFRCNVCDLITVSHVKLWNV